MNKNLLNEDGQTMTEYILIIAVVVVMGVSIFNKMNEYIITNPDSFISTYLNSYKLMFQGGNEEFQGQYKYFTIRK